MLVCVSIEIFLMTGGCLHLQVEFCTQGNVTLLSVPHISVSFVGLSFQKQLSFCWIVVVPHYLLPSNYFSHLDLFLLLLLYVKFFICTNNSLFVMSVLILPVFSFLSLFTSFLVYLFFELLLHTSFVYFGVFLQYT